MTYTCPVCNYSRLRELPERWLICPCCGTEFENDDIAKTYAQLRREWAAGRALLVLPITRSSPSWCAWRMTEP